MHDTGAVGHEDVLTLHPEIHQERQTGNPRCAATGRDQLDILELLTRNLHCVDRSGSNHNGGTVLIVVEDRDTHPLLADALDLKAFRRLDVLEVHRPEGRLQCTDDIGQLLRIGLVDLDIEPVDLGELLEERDLAFHHRLGRSGANVPQPKHRCTVGDNRHPVPFAGIPERVSRIAVDLHARFGNARTVGETEIALCGHRLGDPDRQLPRRRVLVIAQGRFLHRLFGGGRLAHDRSSPSGSPSPSGIDGSSYSLARIKGVAPALIRCRAVIRP